MSMQSESDVAKLEESGNQPPPSHVPQFHPTAPSHELFDISTTVDPSYIISLIRKLLPPKSRNDRRDDSHTADLVNGGDEFSGHEGEEDGLGKRGSTGVGDDELWETDGCILWDLAASKTHAEFMVENLVLEVLQANLMVSQSSRVTEISLGIIGNLACYDVSRKHIVSTTGLIEVIVDQLFLDDTPSLCEACRVLTLGIQGVECLTWAKALQPENILSRILWITENTLNPQLMEKSLGLLLAILERECETVSALLSTLMQLGLLRLLVNLLTFEMSKLVGERESERHCVLDAVLRVIEALSVIDNYSLEVSSNRPLFQLLIDLVKFPDKLEVANSCVTAAVLIANILTDATDLSLEISHDLSFLQGLFDIFPFASDDLEAKSALWSIIARIAVRDQEIELNSSTIHQYVSVFMSKSELLEDELLDHQLDNCDDDATLSAKTVALRKITSILNKWVISRDSSTEEGNLTHDDCINEETVKRLLECCCRHMKPRAGL